MAITIRTSSGNVVDNPTVEQIVYSIFDAPDVWMRKPDASITHTADGVPSSLIIALAKDRGYYVQLLDKSRRMWLLVPTATHIDPEVVEIDEDYLASAGLLNTRASAEAAVRCFVSNGDKNANDLHWLSDHDMPDGIVF